MTKEELFAAWERWMQRNDLAADLDTVYVFALEKAQQSLLMPVWEDALLQYASRMMLHGGLLHLHELAQDDEGAMREMRLFKDAQEDFSFWWSMNNNETVDPFTFEKAVEPEAP